MQLRFTILIHIFRKNYSDNFDNPVYGFVVKSCYFCVVEVIKNVFIIGENAADDCTTR